MNFTSGSGTIDPLYVQVEGTGFFGKLGKTLFGGGNDRAVVLGTIDENLIREAIYPNFKKIIVACLHCWNDLPIFTARDFNFSRSGIFPYSSEDDKAM